MYLLNGIIEMFKIKNLIYLYLERVSIIEVSGVVFGYDIVDINIKYNSYICNLRTINLT